MAGKVKGKAVSQSPDLPPQQDQEGMLNLEELAAFRISPEEYEQDRLARQSIAQKALDDILSGSYAVSASRQSARCSLKISQVDLEEDWQWRNALARTSTPPIPFPSLQAAPSTTVCTFTSSPGSLTALQSPFFHSATPGVCLDKDHFGALESFAIKKTERPKFKHAMSSIMEQLECVVEAERSLRQQALRSNETDVQVRAGRPLSHNQGPFVLYQVRVRPAARLPDGCRYGDWHNERAPKFGILELLRETMALLGVDWNIAQHLEDNDGFRFALGLSRGAPFQTPGWQSLVEVRRLNVGESWEVIAPIKESRLVKEAKARFINRLARSEAESMDNASSANLPGDARNDSIARNDEQGGIESVNHYMASPLDEARDMILDEIDRNITIAEAVHPEIS